MDDAEGREGLGGPQFCEGLGFEAMDRCDNVESLLLSDKDGVKNETLSALGVEVSNKSKCLDYQDFNSKTVDYDGLKGQALEVGVEKESNGNEMTPKKVSVNTESEADLLGVADFTRYARKDGDVTSGTDGKSCSSKVKFGVSDLVWGKVRTHPWWPGQICDPSDASQMARKCFKKGSYLIAYFGDHTFAWNEAPKIKPFLENWSKMEKQSDEEEFQHAVVCALEEVSRRVELGLACSCVSKREYAKLKTQKIVNAGIRKEASRRDGDDSSLGAAYFEPAEVIKFIKTLSQLPDSKADRLELVTSKSQISAFLRWHSYVLLPEDNDTDISVSGEKNHCNEASDEALSVVENEKLLQISESKDNSLLEWRDISDSKSEKCLFPMNENESEGKAVSDLILQPCKKRNDLDAIGDEDVLPVIKDGKLVGILETKDNSLHKCWYILGDSMNPNEEEQSLLDLEGTKCLYAPVSETELEGKCEGKLIPQPSIKKRKEVDAIADDADVKHRKGDSSQGVGSNLNKQSFGVEEFINMFVQQS